MGRESQQVEYESSPASPLLQLKNEIDTFVLQKRSKRDSKEIQERIIMKWHAIRVTYGRELKFQAVLQQAGYETFVPMVMKKVTATPTSPAAPAPLAKQATKQLAPAVSNLLFVRAGQNELYDFFKSMGENCPARFIWDKATRNPITVPDKAMADFITVSKAMLEDTVYLSELNSTLREGQKVRILEGPFAGVEGRIVRIRRSRRILVELPGMLAIAAIFIPSDNLEIIQ